MAKLLVTRATKRMDKHADVNFDVDADLHAVAIVDVVWISVLLQRRVYVDEEAGVTVDLG